MPSKDKRLTKFLIVSTQINLGFNEQWLGKLHHIYNFLIPWRMDVKA